MPQSLLILDDYHLNKNQTKNLTAFLTTNGASSRFGEMNNDLFHVGHSRTPAEFQRRRGAFESKWFPSLTVHGHPQWYRTLYYTEKDLVVECFNRYRCGFRFTWQGTWYCESYNAEYKRIVLDRPVTFSEIPRQMRYAVHTRVLHEERRDKEPSTRDFMQLRGYNLFLGEAEQREAIQELHRYVLQHFYNLSIIPAGHWRIRQYNVVSNMDTGTGGRAIAVLFELFRDEYSIEEDGRDIDHLHAREITVTVTHERNQDVSYSFRFGCLPAGTTGFPCVHMTKIMLQFPNIVGRDMYLRTIFRCTHIPLLTFFHPYW